MLFSCGTILTYPLSLLLALTHTSHTFLPHSLGQDGCCYHRMTFRDHCHPKSAISHAWVSDLAECGWDFVFVWVPCVPLPLLCFSFFAIHCHRLTSLSFYLSLSTCTHTEKLVLNTNKLSDSLPSELGNLKELRKSNDIACFACVPCCTIPIDVHYELTNSFRIYCRHVEYH